MSEIVTVGLDLAKNVSKCMALTPKVGRCCAKTLDGVRFLQQEGIASEHEQLSGVCVSYVGPFRERDFGVLVYLNTEDQLDDDHKTLKRARAVDVAMSADRFSSRSRGSTCFKKEMAWRSKSV